MKAIIIIFCILLLLGLTGCLNDELKVENVWARPGISGGNSAIYLVIDNPADQPDVLLNAACDIAEFAEIHMSQVDERGVLTMQYQETVTIDPRTRLIFRPGGLHVMLIGLRSNLEVGSNFLLQLEFQEAGEILINVEVKEQ